ncbi:Serine protease Do-like HtrA [Aquisphaera giovannonii]|uniref:Serine protease Do-like HtrA n=1 Tax=Aquisphaera giovannonii TaxID=406548 RepID=A0A5B9W0Q6_9BACT|nr:trypsin-like peptidase domain-containing protein [Aquisphaera giovannonii]QEH34196.1 Serine protease Do-like HtrA [Aquisphaera giovannonii]
MSSTSGRSLVACPREVGSRCPYCPDAVAVGDLIMVCQSCGTVHHRACWNGHGGCGAYSCTPARREVDSPRAGVLTISAADLDRAVPLPAARPHSYSVNGAASGAGRGAAAPTWERADPRRLNRLAMASFVCGLAGIPLFGLVTGLVAIGLAAFALAAIRATPQRGLWMAISGMILGMADVVGWLLLISAYFGGASGATELRFAENPPEVSTLADLDPPIRRALCANVLIETGGLLGKAIGSGVILQMRDGRALIVTNRHVVDHGFSGGDSPPPAPESLGELTIRMIGHPPGHGRVVWLAPAPIDLALVQAEAAAPAEAALFRKGRPARVGQPVFAVGNPYRLGWSHTQGVISQMRSQLAGLRQVQVIQTQASINPGNSGGGLYDRDGYLLGINTWTSDKRISEGIGFAIAFDSLLALDPPFLEKEAGKAEAGGAGDRARPESRSETPGGEAKRGEVRS